MLAHLKNPQFHLLRTLKVHMCLVFQTLGEVFQWNNHAGSDAMSADSDGFWANEQLLKGG